MIFGPTNFKRKHTWYTQFLPHFNFKSTTLPEVTGYRGAIKKIKINTEEDYTSKGGNNQKAYSKGGNYQGEYSGGGGSGYIEDCDYSEEDYDNFKHYYYKDSNQEFESETTSHKYGQGCKYFVYNGI